MLERNPDRCQVELGNAGLALGQAEVTMADQHCNRTPTHCVPNSTSDTGATPCAVVSELAAGQSPERQAQLVLPALLLPPRHLRRRGDEVSADLRTDGELFHV